MKTLIIDTTIGSGLIAVAENSKVLGSMEWDGKARHAQILLENIDQTLKKVEWKPNDIEGIGVAIGPGSFTGLRIGLATAKGIAAANNVPIKGYSSLFTLAKSEGEFDGIIVTTIDARRSEVYTSAYDFEKGDEEILKACALVPENLKDWLNMQNKKCLLVGDGAKLYWDQLKGENITLSERVVPRPEIVFEIILDDLKNGGEDIDKLAPSYIRLSDAEIGFRGNS